MTESVTAAEAHAAAARARLGITLSTLQARLAPKALAQEAAQGLLDRGQAAAANGVAIVKRNPITIAGVLAATGLFFARKPIARLLTRVDNATSPASKSSTVRKPRAVKRKQQ